MATMAGDDLLTSFPEGTLVSDPAQCALYAQDVHSKGAAPCAVFRPGNISELSSGLAAAHKRGLAIVPRGGGMSYTRGYLTNEAGALVVDLARMDAILDVDPVDMLVTVEAGCTWAALRDRLKPLGLRVPRWGTLSGIKATVGGGMSQNGVFWGGGGGTLTETAISFDVVLADGTIMRTGSGFVRPFGPDLTGLFAADTGAFGIKAHVTLPLEREAQALAYGSFAFDTPDQAFGAMSEIARQGLATECFGFDPFLQAQRMKRDSLGSDARALVGMMKAQGSFWKAMKEGAKVVAAGRSFLDEARFSAHLIAEGRNDAEAADAMKRVEDIVIKAGGRPVENTIPKVLRANPFPPVNSMLGPEGERWVPVHGLVRHSRALDAIARIGALYEEHASEMEKLGVGAGYMFLTVGRTGFLIEPVFFFPDSWGELHRASVEPAHLARLKEAPANDEARSLVDHLRKSIIVIFGELDAVHMQIGRTYPLKERSDPAAWRLMEAIKRAVDPLGRMNPGALDL